LRNKNRLFQNVEKAINKALKQYVKGSSSVPIEIEPHVTVPITGSQFNVYIKNLEIKLKHKDDELLTFGPFLIYDDEDLDSIVNTIIKYELNEWLSQ